MSTLYDRFNETSKRMLEKYGQPITLTSTSGTSTETRTTFGVFVDTVRHLLGDSGVQIGDKKFLLIADAEPIIGDRMTAGIESYVVMQVDPIRPATTTLAWWAWARAG